MKEETILFGKYQSLVGIVSHPAHFDPSRPAVVLLNGGLIHRVGPSRLYVHMARALAEHGALVLRFDMSGIGDSKVRADNLPFEKSTIDDARQAMDYLQETFGIREFMLMGHCGGAINSIRTAVEDERVVGIVMMNPEGGDTDWDEYDRKRKESQYYKTYYGQTALRDTSRWKRLITGQADYRSIARNVFKMIVLNQLDTISFKLRRTVAAPASDPVRDLMVGWLDTLAARRANVLFIYSEASTGLQRLQTTLGRDLEERVAHGQVRLEIMEHADHNYTLDHVRRRVLNLVEQFAAARVPA
jgi:pimeloyl-ACP methyl ester carboxylesterase